HPKAAVRAPRHALTATTSMASRPKRTYARRRHHAIEHHESSASAFTRAHNGEDSQFPERMCVGLEGRRGSRRRGIRIVGRRQRSKPSLFSTGCQRLRLCCGDCQVNVPLLYDFDGLLPGDLGHLLPRIAIASQGAASAKAESSKNLFTAKAIVAPTKFGEAQATAQWLFIPHDPQGRAQVKIGRAHV